MSTLASEVTSNIQVMPEIDSTSFEVKSDDPVRESDFSKEVCFVSVTCFVLESMSVMALSASVRDG